MHTEPTQFPKKSPLQMVQSLHILEALLFPAPVKGVNGCTRPVACLVCNWFRVRRAGE